MTKSMMVSYSSVVPESVVMMTKASMVMVVPKPMVKPTMMPNAPVVQIPQRAVVPHSPQVPHVGAVVDADVRPVVGAHMQVQVV